MSTPAARPTVVLAHWEGLDPYTHAELERLAAVADLLDPAPLTELRSARAIALLEQAEIVLGHWGCPTIDADALAHAPRLRLFAYAAGTVKGVAPGVPGVATPAVWDRGVVVTSAAAANAEPVAEYTLAAILFANKNVFVVRDVTRDPEAVTVWPAAPTLGNYDKQVGIIGASYVGRRVIALLEPFALSVVVADPYISAAEATRLGVRAVDLDELLATSDVVSVHAPALASTYHLLGARELARMRAGAVLVNTARGSLVDTAALEAELVSGRISAVLDVTDPEPLPRTSALYRLPNVFLTPHVAGAQGTELRRLAACALEEVERHARGAPPRYPVRRDDLDRIA